ncbi:hypothetical protein BLA60_05050 [Actinophytocola xinjiangensis]|uniref:Lipoprotein n=1 Tax=Actinophytocola xinjiangensis TaxID=485602 RepID=A0A7Z0WRK7_9PSEU|nr:hypothetical protein [Actinophytocola xinjiangensis]OLF12662.1 hypothetical protein BLA60_05050 [Actinophytocola xinjiangensis]
MRRLGTVVGAGVLLLLTAACANQQENPTTPPPTPTTTAPADTEPARQPARTPPAGGERVAPQQIDATALPKGYPVMVWTEDDGRTLGVVTQEGGCGKASVEVSSQDSARVAVTMVETVPSDPAPCTMDLRYPKVTTELDQPLDQRTVVLTNEQRKS